LPIVVVAIAMNLANGGMGQVALPALVHAHWGAGGYGALLACMAAGAVIGTLAAARTGKLPNPGCSPPGPSSPGGAQSAWCPI
jgi:hypothetical protein